MLVLCFGLDFKSHRAGGGGGGGGLLHQGCVLTNNLIKQVNPLSNVSFSPDVRGSYSTKSTVAECVKRGVARAFQIADQICWGWVDR